MTNESDEIHGGINSESLAINITNKILKMGVDGCSQSKEWMNQEAWEDVMIYGVCFHNVNSEGIKCIRSKNVFKSAKQMKYDLKKRNEIVYG